MATKLGPALIPRSVRERLNALREERLAREAAKAE